MPALNNRIPKYRKHKRSGRAIVTLDGKDHYLGKFGSKPSRNEYNRLIAEWLAHERLLPGGGDGSTVSTLLAAYLRHAEGYYRKNGKPTVEVCHIRTVVKLLRPSYGQKAAASFGPLALKAVRLKLIERRYKRKYINDQVQRIKRIFR